MWVGLAALAGLAMLGGIATADAPTTPATGAGGMAGGGMPWAGHMMGRGRRAPGVAGVAGAPTSTGFTVTSGTTVYTVTVGSSTTYSYGPGLTAPNGLNAVTAGAHVMVAGTVSGSDVTATAVHIQMPGERGQVTSVSGSEVTVQEPSGRQAVIDISGISNPPSIAQYDEVAAAGSWGAGDTSGVNDTLSAQAVAVVPAMTGGDVTAVTGAPGAAGTATVQGRGGQSVTIDWTASTTFKAITPGASGAAPTTSTPTSLSTGQMIRAQGQWNGPAGASGSDFEATSVTVVPAPPAGGMWGAGGHGGMWGPGGPSGPGGMWGPGGPGGKGAPGGGSTPPGGASSSGSSS